MKTRPRPADCNNSATFISCSITCIRGSHLSVIQVTEASDDLLFVQLIGFELHAPHGLHDAVILQALIPGQRRLHRRTLLQTVHVAFLLARTGRREKQQTLG